MAENLNYAYLQPTELLDSSSWCYDNDPANCDKYGRLYLWSAALDSAALFGNAGKGFGDGGACLNPEDFSPCDPSGVVRGVCPAGWHLPRSDEWQVLFNVTGKSSRFLKAKDVWMEGDGGTDNFGFGALPSGCVKTDRGSVHFYLGGELTDFWTPDNDGRAQPAYFCFEDDFVAEGADIAFPVRCLKDTVVDLEVTYGSMTDERDRQTYKTVTINGQTWMAENLNYAYLQPTSTLDSSSWCYGNEPDSCAKYGRLYLWSAAMDSVALFGDGGKGCGLGLGPLVGGVYEPICSTQEPVRGVCPEKWHVPSKAELEELSAMVKYANLMKSENRWQDGGGSNSFGLGFLPSGLYDAIAMSYRDIHYGSYVWSATVTSHDPRDVPVKNPTFAMKLAANSTQIVVEDWAQSKASSVRCVKDSSD
jgi:uncharacterized protein (TIGR02145 family)